MKFGHVFSFTLGILFAVVMIFFVMPDPASTVTSYAILNDTQDGISVKENWYIMDSFKNDNATIFSAACKPNAFIINDTVTKYLCSLYYSNKVELRHVSNTGSMWPNLVGGGYVIISEIKDKDELKIGDIIIINQTVFGIEVVHRIIEKNQDGEGFYVVTSGDNLTKNDGKRIRFDQIVARVIGIMY